MIIVFSEMGHSKVVSFGMGAWFYWKSYSYHVPIFVDFNEINHINETTGKKILQYMKPRF